MLPLTKILNPNPGWYRGDFHLHTTSSDGHYSPQTLARLALTEGLDFFAITDHNSIASFDRFSEESGLLVIPGIEITLAEGHWNVFGVQDNPEWLSQVCVWDRPLQLRDLPGSITELMNQIAKSGMLNSINHPLLKPWEWRDGSTQLEHIHCLEIWNDPLWPDNAQANPAAIEMWTHWLNAGYRVTAIGGSDFHFLPGEVSGYPGERPGLPTTFVYAKELSSNAIIEGLRLGQAYVSLGPQICFEAICGEHQGTLGTDFGLSSGMLVFDFSVNGAPEGASARLIKNGIEITHFSMHDDQSNHQYKDQLDGSSCWYLLEVIDQSGQIQAITNPVYAGPRLKERHLTFADMTLSF
jgi:hypothetical protein